MNSRPGPVRFTIVLLLGAACLPLAASENVPHRPYAMWADVPEKGQFVAGIVYEESESYHIWASGTQYSVSWKASGEYYGIDINQGYLALQYGLTKKWAADLNLGGTTCGWRYFDNGQVQSTIGMMDMSFGARYQIFNEAEAGSPWVPTLTFRAGAILPGTYDKDFEFAPGLRAAAIEPELLLRKHFGWPGLGVYGDALYRWNRTTANDQYIVSVGFFQLIKGWELDAGYRHLGTISGSDIYFTDPTQPSNNTLVYPRDPRENSDAIEFGFSYTTVKHQIRYGFNLRSVVAGNNSDSKLWVGGSVDVPFGGQKKP